MARERPSLRIAADLRAAIRRGDLAPGDRLPTSAELQTRYGVASQTVANAIDTLKVEGLITGRAGSGVYVRDRAPIIRLARNRLSRSERQAGRGFFLTDAEVGGWTPRSDVTVSTSTADETAAADLHISAGAPVLIRDRVMYANEQPVQLATSYLPRDITEGTPIEQENPGPGGIYARLEEAGHTLTHFREVVSQSPASQSEADKLGVAPGTALWRIVRTAYTEDRPVEVNHISACCDRVELIYEIPAE